jgi:hypothetical protein
MLGVVDLDHRLPNVWEVEIEATDLGWVIITTWVDDSKNLSANPLVNVPLRPNTSSNGWADSTIEEWTMDREEVVICNVEWIRDPCVVDLDNNMLREGDLRINVVT